MFTRGTRLILKLFDFCGISTEYSHLSTYPRIRDYIFTLHILLAVLLTAYFGNINQYFHTQHASLDAFNECTQYALLLASYWIILIESYVKRNNQRSFWQIYENCEINCDSYENQWLLVKVFDYLLISCAANTIAIYWNVTPIDVWLAFMIPGYVNHFRIFFYLLNLELVRSKLQQIEKDLSTYAVKQKTHFLLCIRCKCHELCALIENMNGTYGISHLSTLLCQLYFFYSNVNWFYLHFNSYTGFYMTSTSLLGMKRRGEISIYLFFSISVCLIWGHYSIRLVIYEFREACRCAELVRDLFLFVCIRGY